MMSVQFQSLFCSSARGSSAICLFVFVDNFYNNYQAKFIETWWRHKVWFSIEKEMTKKMAMVAKNMISLLYKLIAQLSDCIVLHF